MSSVNFSYTVTSTFKQRKPFQPWNLDHERSVVSPFFSLLILQNRRGNLLRIPVAGGNASNLMRYFDTFWDELVSSVTLR